MLKIDVDDLIFKMAGKDQTKLRRLHLVKQQLATIDHSPVHPVYPLMIREAITDLDEDGGSTVDAISQFILRKYDVLPVVHSAKLIDQLEKLVEKKEIVFTLENRYMLPVENDARLAELKVKLMSKSHWKNNNLLQVEAGGQMQEEQSIMVEVRDQSHIKELNGAPGFQIEGCEYRQHAMEVDYQRHVQDFKTLTGETEASEDLTELQLQALSINNDQVETQCETRVTGESQVDLQEVHMVSEEERMTLKRQLLKEQKVSEEQGLHMNSKQLLQVDQGRLKVIKKGCRQDVESQTNVEEIQAIAEEIEKTEQPSQLQKALEVTEDQVEIQHQIIVTEDPSHFQRWQGEVEVPKNLPAKEHSQLEKIQTEEIEMRGQDAEVTEAQMRLQELQHVVENMTTDLREEVVAMMSTPVSPNTSQASLTLLKEKCVRLWKMAKAIEQELKSAIIDLNILEVSDRNVPSPLNGEKF